VIGDDSPESVEWLGIGAAASVGLIGVSAEMSEVIARRWSAEHPVVDGAERQSGRCLIVPAMSLNEWGSEPARIPLRVISGRRADSLEVRVGPHAMVMGKGQEPDRIRFSNRRPPSRFEFDLLVDVGINHMLARQGLPGFHGCAFEIDGVGVLGLGESFSGKTTVSVAAMRSGGRLVSDDAVLVIPRNDGVCSLRPVRSFGWLRGRTREIVPSELKERMIETDENGQSRWVLRREDGGCLFVETATPNVVWVQSIDRRLKESRIEAIDHGQVFAALIRASSPLYLSRHCPEIRDKLIPVFRALCEQCRGYRVRLGRRLLEDPVGEMERLVAASL
jgi:hypothetical protein